MTGRTRDNKPGPYAVGYGKPPVHTQFRKGRSGNPSGRAPDTTAGRAKALALEEAYRTVTVKEGGSEVALPAIQAIMRRQVALAAKGNGPAQRAVIAMVQAIEQEAAAQAAVEAAEALRASAKPQMSLSEAARRVAFLLALNENEERERGAPPPNQAPPSRDEASQDAPRTSGRPQ